MLVEDGLVEGYARSIVVLLIFPISYIVNVDAVSLGRYPFPALWVDGIVIGAGIGLLSTVRCWVLASSDVSYVGTGSDGELVIAYVADMAHVSCSIPGWYLVQS